MSIFQPVTLHCPACNTAVEFQGVHSVNADRRPDLRDDILSGTFQHQECPSCGAGFRLDPEFNLVDTQRGEWITAAPLASLSRWRETEERARALFERSYGPDAPEAAQEIGRELHPRITFGWPALREKLLARDHELDDVSLELCKAFIMRSVESPISAESELRLLDVEGEILHFGWLAADDGSLGPTLKVERALYEQIAADEEGAWDELRETLSGGLYVDINRLLMADPA